MQKGWIFIEKSEDFFCAMVVLGGTKLNRYSTITILF